MSTVELGIGSVETPLGPVWICAGRSGVHVVTVPGGTREECLAVIGRKIPQANLTEGSDLMQAMAAELAAYFEGRLRRFSVPLDPLGTPFQRRAWAEIAAIPYGQTTTYRQVAERIGAPRATRAVGAANGANPLAIVIPCHRVVGSDGSLTGYGGGIERKRALLEMERHAAGPSNDISQ